MYAFRSPGFVAWEVAVAKQFRGRITIDVRDSVPDWEPYLQPVAPAGAPSVLYIVLDDVGFAVLSAKREGDGMPTTGTLSLYINDDKVGEGRITTQPGNFSLVGEGLNVGKDPAEPITDDYPGTRPYAFTGGTVQHAIVDVSGEPHLDPEREAAAMMARE